MHVKWDDNQFVMINEQHIIENTSGCSVFHPVWLRLQCPVFLVKLGGATSYDKSAVARDIFAFKVLPLFAPFFCIIS